MRRTIFNWKDGREDCGKILKSRGKRDITYRNDATKWSTYCRRRWIVSPPSLHGTPVSPSRAPRSNTRSSPRYRTRPVSPKSEPANRSHAMMMASPLNSGRCGRRSSHSNHPISGCGNPQGSLLCGLRNANGLPTSPDCVTTCTTHFAIAKSSAFRIVDVPACSKHLNGCVTNVGTVRSA